MALSISVEIIESIIGDLIEKSMNNSDNLELKEETPSTENKKYTRKKCPHGKYKFSCKVCGGSSYCDHDKIKYTCIICNACEHGKIKTKCIQCNGGSICDHNKRRSRCADCHGGSICGHNRLRSRCIDCNGSSICPHKRRKDHCTECALSTAICEHKNRKSRCRECDGIECCPHNKLKVNCIECDTSGNMCEHGKIKSQCAICHGSKMCIHDKRKHSCVVCTPSSGCQHCKLISIIGSKWKPYCFRCYCVLHPDAEIPRAYKLKEHYVRDALKEEFKDSITMVFDKKVDGGCSRLRPDILLDFGSHCIIVEIDERQHVNYSCEEKRMVTLYEDIGFRKIVFLRFNPDGYTFGKKTYKSPFSYTATGAISIDRGEMSRRILELVERIKTNKAAEPSEQIVVEYLFYDAVRA